MFVFKLAAGIMQQLREGAVIWEIPSSNLTSPMMSLLGGLRQAVFSQFPSAIWVYTGLPYRAVVRITR